MEPDRWAEPVSWTTLIAKPEYARTVPLASRELLNTLESIVCPMRVFRPFKSDRYVVMGNWLRMAKDTGLLRPLEYSQLRFDLAQVM